MNLCAIVLFCSVALARPASKEAYYNLGVTALDKVSPERMKVRKQAGMRPGDAGPIGNFNLRTDLRNRFSVVGHPLLAPAATQAVKQYVYKPTLVDGQPVEVSTTVVVEFRLAQ